MKKMKITLTAVAVFAIVGGALAFKAKKTEHTFYCYNVATQKCDIVTKSFSTTSLLGTAVHCTTTILPAPPATCTITLTPSI